MYTIQRASIQQIGDFTMTQTDHEQYKQDRQRRLERKINERKSLADGFQTEKTQIQENIRSLRERLSDMYR